MAVWTEELATDLVYPNLEIYRRFKDGVHSGYRLIPCEGYVMYDITRTDTEPLLDENGNQVWDDDGNPAEVPVTYYYTVAYLPRVYNFDNFPWRAALRSSVDENYIFGGGGNNDHEIM